MSAVIGGLPVNRFPRSTSLVAAHFRFAALPRPGRVVTVGWYDPSGRSGPLDSQAALCVGRLGPGDPRRNPDAVGRLAGAGAVGHRGGQAGALPDRLDRLSRRRTGPCGGGGFCLGFWLGGVIVVPPVEPPPRVGAAGGGVLLIVTVIVLGPAPSRSRS